MGVLYGVEEVKEIGSIQCLLFDISLYHCAVYHLTIQAFYLIFEIFCLQMKVLLLFCQGRPDVALHGRRPRCRGEHLTLDG